MFALTLRQAGFAHPAAARAGAEVLRELHPRFKSRDRKRNSPWTARLATALCCAALVPLAWTLSASGAEVRPATKPNIVFILIDDLGERHDLAGSQPEKRRELALRLDGWLKEVGAQMPVQKPAARPPQ